MKHLLLVIYYFIFCINIYAQKEITIVCFGNSTTALRKNVKNVYAQRLQEKSDSAGIVTKIINSGVASSHTGSIRDNEYAKVVHAMDRFDTAVLKYEPDWVTINFGLNDAYQDKGIGTPSRIPLKNFEKNIKYFIRKIKRNGGNIILITPNPLGKKFEQFRHEKVREYADCIRKIAKRKNILLIDSWKLFYEYANQKRQPVDILFTDGIHPNDTGHELIAKEIFNIISKKK